MPELGFDDQALPALRQARAAYRAQEDIEHYDEVLSQVAARAQEAGDLGKADIGALLFWKRLRADTSWATRLHLLPDVEVRAATRAAREAMKAETELSAAAGAGRRALGSLPGFANGDALASAVLVALEPSRMAIYDRRAHAGLTTLGLHLDNRFGRYSRYMTQVGALVEAINSSDDPWTVRDVDLSLFRVGGQGG